MCLLSSNKSLKKLAAFQYIASGLLAFYSQHSIADEIASKAIERAVSAYGAEALMTMQQLSIKEQQLRYTKGQSGHAREGAHGIVLHKYNQQLNIDFVNKNKVFKRSDQNLLGNYGYHTLVTLDRRFIEGKGAYIDHCLQTFQPSERLHWNSVGLGMEHGVDTLIVKQLAKHKKQVSSEGVAYIHGQAHDVLKYQQNNELHTVFINTDSGLVSRVIRKAGEQPTRYDFLVHTKNRIGITWATEVMVSREQHPIAHVTERSLTMELPLSLAELMPAKYKRRQPVAYLDFEQPSVNQLADGVFLVGQGWSFTLFADIGKSYVSMGAWQMPGDKFTWQKRLEKLHQFTAEQKPVSHFIVTHHHDDHLMGLSEVVEHGAQLLMLPQHVNAVKASLSIPIDSSRLTLVRDALKVANDKVQVFDVPSSHADHNLVVYLPEQKILFAEDMFGSSLARGFHSPNSWPSRDVYYRTETLNKKLQSVRVDVAQYVSSHHGRVLSKNEFNQALSLTCPSDDVLKQRLFGS
ncbi:hypothetical protein [Pseudoalteromonas luteoviolacea]|uniref:hypothetical protein n=1 Tax=Pseudoalteromonas luteoviolacea TaxID=43657 RepID=UPI001B368299|nr:hypothetical protein [Pseudoalteromonas luteoviolacea]MBQ4835799.1 hypothetical protein [Pseudoalteromonas luteoviolacea]